MALMALVAAGCKGNPPCSGKVVLTIQFPAFAVNADEMRVAVVDTHPGQAPLPSPSPTQSAPHTPGATTGTMNLQLAQYQAGDVLDIQFQALAQGMVLASVERQLTLSGSCTSLTIDLSVTETKVRVAQNTKNKVDLLFMVDDSPSMIPKQQELQNRFPQLIQVLDDFAAMGLPAWYHIGVVTSDLGAGAGINGGCVPGGKGAKLQALGVAHGASCQAPTGGLNFIDYNQLNGTNNLPTGATLPTEFTCMAQVGAAGCGFEHQLEAPYRALHNCMPAPDGSYPNCTIPENVGFLRPDSILAVVFLTDEDDDCSAPDDTDLFDANKASTYGMEASYRGSQYGVMCNYMGMDQLLPYGDSGGPLTACHAAPNPMTITGASGNSSGFPPPGQGKCNDIQRYINFYKSTLANGGVRVDPSDVILAAIDGPSDPVMTVLGNPSVSDPTTPGGYAPCAAGAMVGTQTCAVLLGHSCNASTNFFGDPAVRINQMITSVSGDNPISSICAQDYSAALTSLGQKIVSKIGISCLASPLTDPTKPDCTVEDRDNLTGSLIDTIPSCASNGNTPPCWLYQENNKCAQVVNPTNASITQGSISINRGQSAIPPNSTAQVTCTTATVPGAGTPL
jgi:hypothetical protein